MKENIQSGFRVCGIYLFNFYVILILVYLLSLVYEISMFVVEILVVLGRLLFLSVVDNENILSINMFILLEIEL